MPALGELLSPQAQVVHRTRRFLFEKRIVEWVGQSYVLYRFPTPWQARRLRWLLDTAAQLSIPMQHFVCTGSSSFIWWRGGGAWVVLSHEPGRTPRNNELKGDLLTSLATALAQLHSLGSKRSGALFAVGLGGAGLARNIQAQVGGVLAAARGVDSAAHLEMRAWLVKRGRFLDAMKCFHLTHGDLLTKNLLVRDGGTEICLIDYELAAFEHAGFELATTLIRFFGERSEARRHAFLKSYFDVCPAAIRSDWEAHWPYFLIVAALRMAASRARRSRILMGRGDDEVAAQHSVRGETFLARAFAMLRVYQSGGATVDCLLQARPDVISDSSVTGQRA